MQDKHTLLQMQEPDPSQGRMADRVHAVELLNRRAANQNLHLFALQHGRDDVLADIMQVSLDGADHHGDEKLLLGYLTQPRVAAPADARQAVGPSPIL